MGAAGLGVVVGWCAVWYAASGTVRGRITATGVTVAGMLGAHVAAPGPADFTVLGAAVIAALAHAFFRRLLSRAKGIPS